MVHLVLMRTPAVILLRAKQERDMTTRLAFAQQLVEISFTAVAQDQEKADGDFVEQLDSCGR